MSKARLEFAHEERVARITLAAPKANILDRAMIAELDAAFASLAARQLHAIVLGADGPHFSFGASVKEHLPDKIADTLAALHGLLRRVAEAPAPVIAAVNGQCLGGGFELVLACDLILAAESAQFGCPEIKLGVFPPAASALLPARVSQAIAARLLLTGEAVSGEQAGTLGLAARVAHDISVGDALEEWLAAEFLPRSPAALKYAAQAVRGPVRHALDQDLPRLEQLYLHELLSTPDAVEGIKAFLEKRPAKWARGTAGDD